MTLSNNFDLEIATGPFDPSWESLRSFECPDWFRDAKLAFWSHWGPQCVPMFGDWYARNLYFEGHDQYRHHWRIYGHPSKVGYKDIVPLWKAESFDPDGLMDLFVQAGARYFFGQAMHHDNFDLFDSAHQPWNSVRVGPKKDIVGLWKAAAQKRGLPFALSEHLAASFSWFGDNKMSDKSGPYAGIPYDGNDPKYADLYYDNAGHSQRTGSPWYTEDQKFHQHWFDRIKDLIDKYQPDLLYSDGGLPFDNFGRHIVAHLYNTSIKLHGSNRAIYTQKDTNPDVYRVGLLDIERGQTDGIAEFPWQTDTSIGDWFYNVKDVYKTPAHVAEMLVDVVSKNGNLVMNIPQKPDGTLDEECDYLLRQMSKWVKANGEGIYGSRPWIQSGEGAANAISGAFKESAVAWTPEDFRFTKTGETVFAYQMKPSESGKALIRSFSSSKFGTVTSVRALGGGPASFRQSSEGLTITLPAGAVLEGPVGFAVNQG